MKLGDSVLALYARRLYAAPCDEDGLPHHKLRVIAYGGRLCRGRQFDNGTSVLLFTDYDEADLKNQAIRTVAWLGGTYFHQRSNFPLKIGHRVRGKKGRKKVASLLKQTVIRTMALEGKSKLSVTTLTGAIHLIDDGKELVGIVLGPMPETTKSSLWQGVSQFWEKYTRVKEK